MALTIELRYVVPRKWCRPIECCTFQEVKAGKKEFAAGVFWGDSAFTGGRVEYSSEDVVHYAIGILD
jgi:hypothetical protein